MIDIIVSFQLQFTFLASKLQLTTHCSRETLPTKETMMSFAKRYRKRVTKRALEQGRALLVLDPDEVTEDLIAGRL
jgi:hypothetical protein